MNWTDVGSWLKNNAGTGAALVGSLLTGNVPGAVAAGVALVGSATGTNDPAKALAALQGDPATVLKLRELAVQEEASSKKRSRYIRQVWAARQTLTTLILESCIILVDRKPSKCGLVLMVHGASIHTTLDLRGLCNE